MTRVRIVILNYNTTCLTIKLVNKLLLQVYNNFEIIVVDNNSLIAEQELLISSLPKTVFLIQSKINLGYSGGNNLGMKYINDNIPDYYLILNSDLQIEDDFLIQKLIDGFAKYPSINILAQSPLINTLGNPKPVGLQIQVRKLLSPLMLYLLSFSLFKKLLPDLFGSFIYKDKMPINNKYLICDSINGAAFIINANFIRSINYLDENVFLYHEEMILAKQIQSKGGICLLNGFIQVDHIQGASTGSNLNSFNARMERMKYQSESYFFKKYLHLNPFLIILFKFFKEVELWFKIIIYKT